MKKPIDPNLNNLSDEDFLLSADKLKDKPNFSFEDSSIFKEPEEPHFKVTQVDEHGLTHRDNPDIYSSSSGHSSDHHSSSHHSSGHHHSSSHHSSSHHHHSSSHHSSSRHNSKKKKMPLAARIIIAVALILLLIIIIVGGTFFILQQTGKKDMQTSVTEDTAYQETIEYKGHTYVFDKDVVSMAFIGVDQRDLDKSSNKQFVGAADADIILAVDTKDATAKVIAIPRDTVVDVDTYSKSGVFLNTQKMQLCLAYAYGDGKARSCTNVTNSISRILYDVPIDKYFALDLNGIAPLNDAIGGVTVESLYDFNTSVLNVRKGETVTLKGDMAEAYVRTRSLDNINASLNRTERQVQYVKAYVSQAVPAAVKDFGIVSSLYNTASEYSQTNISVNNVTYLASLLLSKGVTGFDTYKIEGEMKEAKMTEFPDAVHAEFYPDEDNLMETVLEVYYDRID